MLLKSNIITYKSRQARGLHCADVAEWSLSKARDTIMRRP